MSRKTCFLIVFLVIFVGCVGVNKKRDFYYQKGQKDFIHKQFESAEQSFQNAVQVDPQFGEGYRMLAECYTWQNRWTKAESLYRKAIHLNSELFDARLSLAEILIMDNKIDESQDYIDFVLSKYPENLRALLLSSIILHKKNRIEEAETILNHIISRSNSSGMSLYISLAEYLSRDAGEELFTPDHFDGSVSLPLMIVTCAYAIEKYDEDLDLSREKITKFFTNYGGLLSGYYRNNEFQGFRGAILKSVLTDKKMESNLVQIIDHLNIEKDHLYHDDENSDYEETGILFAQNTYPSWVSKPVLIIVGSLMFVLILLTEAVLKINSKWPTLV